MQAKMLLRTVFRGYKRGIKMQIFETNLGEVEHCVQLDSYLKMRLRSFFIR